MTHDILAKRLSAIKRSLKLSALHYANLSASLLLLTSLERRDYWHVGTQKWHFLKIKTFTGH